MTVPAIEGKRIRFTRLNAANIYKHFEWNNDPELNRLDSEVPYEEETFGDFKRRFERMAFHPTPHAHDFEIHASDGALIGVAYVGHISMVNRNCSVSLTIGDRNYWGQGYGRESLLLLLKFCFEELGMHRVGTETFEYNEAWQRLVEDVGFTHEGTERDYLFRDGTFWDKEVYGLLEDEYRSGRDVS